MINNFEFFKASAPLDEELQALSVYDIFELDTFVGKQAGINKEQINAILDRFNDYNKVPIMAVLSSVTAAIVENFEVTEDTPVKDIIALCYILFMTDTFGTEVLMNKVQAGIRIDNTFRYFEEMEVTAPIRFIDDLRSRLNNQVIFEVLQDRNDFNVVVEMSDEDYQRFLEVQIPKITAYVAGADATKGLLGDILGI